MNLFSLSMGFSLLALLSCAPTALAASNTELLADHPTAYVEDGLCHIHGAVWAGKPVRNAELILAEVDGPGLHTVRTDKFGEYRISIPVSEQKGYTAIYQERDASRGSSVYSRWSRPKVVCRVARVELGPVEKVQ